MARRCRTPRRALTLLEVILVLALLVVLASVVWPELEPVLASLQLRKSAERVRVEWERARVEALSTGRTILFRYMPNSNRYCVQRLPEPEFVPGSSGSTSQQDADTQREDVLPERISFVRSDISDNSSAEPAGDLQATAQGEWSDPVMFYPDGTTSDATFVLTNERGQNIELSLRGLTGVVTVGSVYTGGEAGS